VKNGDGSVTAIVETGPSVSSAPIVPKPFKPRTPTSNTGASGASSVPPKASHTPRRTVDDFDDLYGSSSFTEEAKHGNSAAASATSAPTAPRSSGNSSVSTAAPRAAQAATLSFEALKYIEKPAEKTVEEHVHTNSSDGLPEFWAGAMNDLAARKGDGVSAREMLDMASKNAFDETFLRAAMKIGGFPTIEKAKEAILKEAVKQLPVLKQIVAEQLKSERQSEQVAAQEKEKGLECMKLWVCGYCGNSNPDCPYRATKSGGYYILVPIDMAKGGALATSQGVADLHIKAAAGFGSHVHKN
jgi:hypothetical protein